MLQSGVSVGWAIKGCINGMGDKRGVLMGWVIKGVYQCVVLSLPFRAAQSCTPLYCQRAGGGGGSIP